ncbi:class I SAM-dependent methyltransferase [Streptomyces hoynatensis]|uniref:Class I SAM-dependent methyltransferase n=1 Tax=Streptomyces hoynatensis TaxID=1141874 RepID=A0A3A9ZG61_9ACTN|nr:class I SAM-dependent methyltransferase [Streptomyces hoynatensis]
MDWATEAERLAEAADRDAEWLARAARELLPAGARLAVDLGCGGGGMAVALAQQGPAGLSVAGLDGEPAVLAAARRRAERIGGAAARVRFAVARLEDGGEALRAVAGGAPDLLWVAGAVHHVPDQQRAVDGLAAALAPGGVLALAEGGLRVRHLPWDVGVGAPGLEDRLDAAQMRWFGRMRASLPGVAAMPYGWPEALRRAGLGEVATRTFLVEHEVRPGGPAMASLLASLGHRVARTAEEGLLSEEDREAFRRLLDEGDPAWLGRRTDLGHVEARSVYTGRRPA